MLQERDPTRAERELLDTIERGGRSPAGRSAVQLHLSQLLPSNRPASRLRIASRLFAPLEISHALQIFLLSNGDLFILGKDIPEAQVDSIVHRVRSLFDHDPLAFQDFEDEHDPFVTWYAYEIDLDDLLAVVRNLLEAAEIVRKQRLMAPAPPEPLSPSDLDDLRGKLQTLNIRPMLRRQPCIRLQPKQHAEIMFEEITVGITEVKDAIAPTKDLFADRWLFQDLSRTLDSVLLSALPQAAVLNRPPAISLNLNLESINSREFQGLINSLGPKQRVIAEIQVIDIFTNLATYQSVRDGLRESGHAILVDGLSPAMLGAMDMSRLDPDFVKILWAADLAAPQHPRKGEGLSDLVAALGAERVILSRCESEQAMTWGLTNGMTAFQGRYMDAILGTVTLQQCPSSSQCTMRECIARRASVMGRRRNECPNIPWLDQVQVLSSPAKRQA